MVGPADTSLLRRDAELFAISGLLLYLELVLIRWLGTEVRIFAYLGNLVLVVCFYGIGVGCFLSERPISTLRWGVNLALLVALVAARQPVTPEMIHDPILRDHVRANLYPLPGLARPTTDDWPYLYLERPKIPNLHLLTAGVMVGGVLLARRRLFGPGGGLNGHFFALGPAFLLLEVQTVSRATLLFGMTWVVNAIVIAAVLVMILLANLVAARWPRLPQWGIVAGLAATVGALASVPLDWFNTFSGAGKLLAASVFLTGPVFFAGLIFIRSFAACADRSRALGSNLIGALLGGLLESVSFITGLRALVGLVGLLYAVALWLRPGPPRPEAAA